MAVPTLILGIVRYAIHDPKTVQCIERSGAVGFIKSGTNAIWRYGDLLVSDTPEFGSDRTPLDHAAFVLRHPRMSRWIKNAVREAMDEDPISVLNDLEILRVIMLLRTAEDRGNDRR